MALNSGWTDCVRDFARNYKSQSGGVIILASGPSAGDFPLKKFSSLPVMAMNGSIMKCTSENIHPYFYLCDDNRFVTERSGLAKEGVERAQNIAMTMSCFEILNSIFPGILSGKNLYVLNRVNRVDGKPVISDRRFAWSIRKDHDLLSGFSLFSKKMNRVGFSRNLSKGYFGSRTIPFAGLQLACHLGFEKVFMVGVDLNPAAGRFYEAGQTAMPSTLDVDFSKYILPSFALMSKRAISKGGFEVFNLSANSRLPDSIVKKISVDDMESGLVEDEKLNINSKDRV